MKEELIELFKTTRKLTTEWFEADNLEVLYYTKKDNKVNVYYIEDKTLKPLFNCDNNGNEDLYKLANENDYYINDSELIHI